MSSPLQEVLSFLDVELSFSKLKKKNQFLLFETYGGDQPFTPSISFIASLLPGAVLISAAPPGSCTKCPANNFYSRRCATFHYVTRYLLSSLLKSLLNELLQRL